MSENPYKKQMQRAFWSKTVSENFNEFQLVNPESEFLKKGDKVTSAGSCFASNLVPYIEAAGLKYIKTEQMPSIFADLGENLGYANFSASYGNIYTPAQLLQLYKRSIGEFFPDEDRWHLNGEVIDPFRPGLKFPAVNDEEFDELSKSHLRATREAFETADVFVFTLGLTEAWVSAKDSAVFPACPGTISGEYNSNLHKFINFSVDEIVRDTSLFIEKVRLRNPKLRFILTVSPVPLVATATNNHVLVSSIYSKSVLRVATEEISTNLKHVEYFPAYEIVTGPQAPKDFFELDRRNVSKKGVDSVMKALLTASSLIPKENFASKKSFSKDKKTAEKISKAISVAECDEAMLDRFSK